METIRNLINQTMPGIRAEREIRLSQSIEAVYKKYPALEDIDHQIIDMRKQRFVAAIGGDEKIEDRMAEIEAGLIKKRDLFIKDNDIDPDFDKEKFICDKCEDKGFVKTKSGLDQVCCCRDNELKECFSKSGMSGYETYDMKSLKDDYFGDEAKRKSKKLNLVKIISNTGDFAKKNLWIYYGNAQSGKTYMSVCITKASIKLGHSAYYMKCEEIADMSESDMDFLKRCDLLVIDDFTDDVTLSKGVGYALNSVLEARGASELKTILVTSISPTELSMGSDMRIAGKLKNAGVV